MEENNLSEKESIVKGLIKYALSEVERKYGNGTGDGESPRGYHNKVHTQDTLSASEAISKLFFDEGKISASDIYLIRIAASFHDIEQDLGSGKNEIECARVAEEEMRKVGLFKEEDFQKVRNMIMATTVLFENGVMRQTATDDVLTRILTDADLSSLGQETEMYWNRAEGLLKEIKKTDVLEKDDTLAFLERQLILLENHQFYTDIARKLYTHKQENIEFVKQYLKTLKG